jgi:hypothetical protein
MPSPLPWQVEVAFRKPNSWYGRGTARDRQGNGMVCVNQTRPHCVNQMEMTQSKSLTEGYGRRTAGERHGMCETELKQWQRERGLRAVAPYSGVSLNLQMSKTRILIRLLRTYFPRNW